jgi:hypothetical protein
MNVPSSETTYFWGMQPCRAFISLMTETVRTSETSVYFNESAWRYIQEGCHHHTRYFENLKPQKIPSLGLS